MQLKCPPGGAQLGSMHFPIKKKKKLSSEISEDPSSMPGRAHLWLVGKPAVRKPVRPNTLPFTWAETFLTRSHGSEQ